MTVNVLTDDQTTVQVLQSSLPNVIEVVAAGPQGAAGEIPNTGSFATTGSNSFVGNQVITGSLTVSGSSTFTNIGPAVFSGSVESTQGFTGSLQGTASMALSASFAQGYVLNSNTSSFVTNSQTGSFLTSTSTGSFLTSISTGSFATTASLNTFTSSYNTGSFTGSFTGTLSGTASYATQALSASWAPGGTVIDTGSFATTGSNTFVGNQHIIGSVTASKVLTDLVRFNTSAGVSVGVGELAWNNSDGTLDLGMKGGNVVQQIGQELFYEVRNETGIEIPNGTAVYANGVTAGSARITASPYTADGSVREVRFLGIATEDISNGVNGFVTYFGYVRGLDTRGTTVSSIAVGDEDWSVGDVLYAHPTVAGKLTNVAPKHEISVAIVIARHQSAGVLFVRPTSYGHLEDIHDTNITTASLATGQMLLYNSGTDYWENTNSLSGSYQLTGSLNITGSATLNESNIVSSNTIMKIETISSASYAALTPPVSGTLYIII